MQLEGVCRAAISAYTTPDATFRIYGADLSGFIGGSGMRLKRKCIHGTAFDTFSTSDTGLRFYSDFMVGMVHAFGMSENMKRLKIYTAALAAVADGVDIFLPVGNGMY
jgi:hypothetical protein